MKYIQEVTNLISYINNYLAFQRNSHTNTIFRLSTIHIEASMTKGDQRKHAVQYG